MNRIYIMGAGAVGAYFGALLVRAGYDVTFITRGQNLVHFRRHGIRVRSRTGNFDISPANFRDTLDGLPEADLILFTVKSHDTDEAAQAIKSVVGKDTLVLTIQNGIDNPERIGAVIGQEKVLPGFTLVGVSVNHPEGTVDHGSKGEIYFSEWNGEVSRRVSAINDTFRKANIPVFNPPDIRRAMWRKFLWNCTINIPTAVCNLPFNRFHECSESAVMLDKLMAEVVAVGRAEGVVLTPDDVNYVLDSGKSFNEYVSSTQRDVRLRKRKLEYESFVGKVVQLARKHGLSVPVNETLYSLMKALHYDIIKYSYEPTQE